MRCPRVFIALICVCSTALTAHVQAQSLSTPVSSTPPEVSVQAPSERIVLDSSGLATIRVTVQIPTDHHGYLDRGDEGFLIPLRFSFDALEARGFRVSEIDRPRGVRDEEVHATVLRGRGDFAFRLVAPSADFRTDTAMTASLAYQICNDVTNICYPPRTTEFPLWFETAAGAPSTASTPPISPSPAAVSRTLRERVDHLFQQHAQNLPLAFAVVFIAGDRKSVV